MAPTQVLLQSGPGLVAAGQQELRGASGGAVNQPHRQLQDRRTGYRRSRGGQVSQTHPQVSSRPLPSSTYGPLRLHGLVNQGACHLGRKSDYK